MKNIVIIGATSSIAEHCARLWVKAGAVNLTLVGRNTEKTEQVASDLRVRSPESNIQTLTTDFNDPATIESFISDLFSQNHVDLGLIAHGSLPDQTQCQENLELVSEALEVNAISPVLFAEAFIQHMESNGFGTLGIIGSVAGDRGRKSNYVYGAAKGLVTRYAQGLQHRLANSNIHVCLIKPGPTTTPMTAHMENGSGSFASPNNVATAIVNGMEKQKPVIYAPTKWMIIMMIIRHLPRFIFNKMDI